MLLDWKFFLVIEITPFVVTDVFVGEFVDKNQIVQFRNFLSAASLVHVISKSLETWIVLQAETAMRMIRTTSLQLEAQPIPITFKALGTEIRL